MFLRNGSLIRAVNTSRSSYPKSLSTFVEINKSYPAEPGHVRKSPYKDIVIPNQTLDKYIWNNFRLWENKIAAVRVIQ